MEIFTSIWKYTIIEKGGRGWQDTIKSKYSITMKKTFFQKGM